MVFVGYGVHAPERHWDDFKGVDLKGKVAVFLVNDPDFDAAPGEPVAGRFGGKTMTYYGRWTYKYEEAARRGAVAALIVHDTAGASYPWSTVVAPGGEAYDVEHAATESRPVPVQGWLEGKAAAALFQQAGLDLEALRIKARSESFRPVTLKHTTLSADLPVTVDRLHSQNVLAKITGAKYPDETVMFGAHWDAYGKSTDAQGNTVIRRGAIDDGSGIAALFEIARAFKAGPKPDRTIRFAAWTGEERGLLGSGWYVAHPLAPLDKTAANLTMDVLQMAGPAHNAFIIGAGQDTLQEQFAAAVALQGRTAQPEAMPERGAFYRADHLLRACRGPGSCCHGHGGQVRSSEGRNGSGWQMADGLHGLLPSGLRCLEPGLGCAGAAQDVWAVWKVGHDVAFSHDWPQWKAGSEFAAIRQKTAPATVQ